MQKKKGYWPLLLSGGVQVEVDEAVSQRGDGYIKLENTKEISSERYSKCGLSVCNVCTKVKHMKCRAMIRHKCQMLFGT